MGPGGTHKQRLVSSGANEDTQAVAALSPAVAAAVSSTGSSVEGSGRATAGAGLGKQAHTAKLHQGPQVVVCKGRQQQGELQQEGRPANRSCWYLEKMIQSRKRRDHGWVGWGTRLGVW